ncbi:hypothetical protein DLAC_07522 [Tieghemostelium lacteum]|uniref:MADS-box domain-containing protein n=1 Tax=Tieghemostelium lacteum TaxID=361077 RepID=A0A151ZCR2_TIELA|nr:hypothetical protein DLAC_07522 [Tieghemostelium lacteum]|eukprot:KYQ91738.1 hypothetical protein DLAC_07522 [Tieghemostelium lacteum]
MFLTKELQLQDYMIENHPPKFALQFHWPKKIEKTETMDDYYSTWSTQNPDIQAFQINRSKLERDMTKMVIDQGVKYYHGRVKDIDINSSGGAHSVDIQILSNEENFEDHFEIDRVTIQAEYIVDASGRNFAIGSRTDNLLKDPKDLYGLQNASTWVRVKNVDKKLFDFNNPNVTASWYYATNHFFGPGYWIWMIPLERGSHDFSIGISYHRDKIECNQLNTQEKFMKFLEKNQKLVYNLISSGEIVDFHRWPKIAHTSRVFYSHDNWAVIGDAAAIFDPFYSTGISMMAIEIECLTELLKYKLNKDTNGYNLRLKLFNGLITSLTKIFCHLIKKHSDHLGNASVMSWRIYIESSSYFGIDIPSYIGKYHLCPDFIKIFLDAHPSILAVRDTMLETLDDINNRGLNIGFMDNHRGGQLKIVNWSPITSWDSDECLALCKYDRQRLNLPYCLQRITTYQLIAYTMLYIKAYGWRAMFNNNYLFIARNLLSQIPKYYIGSWIHYFKNFSKPNNDYFESVKNEFEQQYSYSVKNQHVPF